jgi:tetratricopeptide (TPR) repeat protein
VNGKPTLLIIVAALAGLVGGFLLANTINRSELSTLRAENERFKTERANPGSKNSSSELTDEEISETIAKADERPDDFATQRNIGVAIYRYGSIKQNPAFIRQSIRLLDRAAQLKPDDYDVMLSLGNANFDVGSFEKDNDALAQARTHYAKALSSKPNDPDVLVDVALTYYLQTPPDLDSSVSEFRKALAADPKHEKTLQFMIQALLKQNKAAEASDLLQRLRTVNPKNESIDQLTSMIAAQQPAG